MRARNYFLLATLLGFSTNLVAREYTDCLEIPSHLERLECYDILAGKEKQGQLEAIEPVESIAAERPQEPVVSGQVESTSQSVSLQPAEPAEKEQEAIESVEPVAAEVPEEAVASDQVESASQSVSVLPAAPAEKEQASLDTAPPDAKGDKGWSFFGKSEPKKAPQQVRARIDSIRESPLGNRIMTLSNGQVWAENEAGRLKIQTEQAVTITKKRFNFEMKLESGKKVAVRRID